MSRIHDKILAINSEQSDLYVAAESARQRYWAKHATFFACVKCMDGRVLFPTLTKTPVGIVKPFRAIGGKFEVWWPSFLGRVRRWVEIAQHSGSRSCMFVTYHFSASDTHLGCAGWGYDTKAARAHAEKLHEDLSYIFGEQLTPIVVGVETDQDNLTLHGSNGDVSGEMLIGKSESEILQIVLAAFPQMNPSVAADLIPFLVGNAQCVEELKQHPHMTEKGHNERIIAVGQAFDWLVKENVALIINDSDPNLAESIRVAGSLIEKNTAGQPIEDDATIFTCVPYRAPGLDYRQAVARAKGLRVFTEHVVRKAYPNLFADARMKIMSAVMWEPSKKIEVIEAE
jgi:hypothetical protein